MFTLIEALNYRCLRYVKRSLGPFHVLVGPNASGKTTFLDVISFLSDLVYDGLKFALSERSQAPEELLFARMGDRLELAVEARIPYQLRKLTSKPDLDTVRYEVAIGFDENQRSFELREERLLLKKASIIKEHQRSVFPCPQPKPNSLLTNINRRDNKVVVRKTKIGNDNFYSETYGKSGRGWTHSIRLGTKRSAFGNLLADSDNFPVANWFHDYLAIGVRRFVLNSNKIKRPSPPTRFARFRLDGSNIPWVIARMRKENRERYDEWIAHLQTAIDDLKDIKTIERPEDKHCYMVYEYAGGMKIPSWLVSDGTLRLTALTLPAYLPRFKGAYLIEEPENGIHPQAVETACESLSSMYQSQVLLTTHSPMVLNNVDVDKVLCFAKDDNGATDIVLGSEHPMLRSWQRNITLGTLLASGVLG